MKKTIALLLCLIVLLISVAGCGNRTENGGKGTAANPVATTDSANGTGSSEQPGDDRDPLRELPDTDKYEGYKFRVLMRPNAQMITDMFAEETDGDSVSNAVYLRNKSLEEKYGVVLELVKSENANADTTGIKPIQAGLDAYDLIAPHGARCINYAMSDCCLNWYDLPYLNLTYDWWAQGARDSFTFSNTLLFMTGDLSHLSTAASYVIVFNKDLLRQHNIDYPYQEVKDGTWTFERMSEIAIDCAFDEDNDGVCTLDSEKDVLGYVTYPWGGTYCALFASGTHILSRDENDMPNVTIASETSYDALKKFFDLATGNYAHLDTKDTNPKVNPAVIANRVVFHDTNLITVASQFRQTTLNYGILPYPKTAEVDRYASHVAGAVNVYLIPKTVTDRERTALVLEYLAQEGHRLVIPPYYESLVTGKSMRDAESYEMLPIISASRLYDFGYYDSELKGIQNLLEQLAKKDRSVTKFYSLYNENISTAQDHLRELIELYSKY